ncbi:uncharacterized protein LOC127242251 [Andrographis paniculata]|uniref:uncharacterized protein LOC127242251 n=1 Tax=Andrographis paniculata TaxID=175694 RepID=UPI0021E998A4|nr:uncharacterized protein LOC127242251 [Andrographis paniculata]
MGTKPRITTQAASVKKLRRKSSISIRKTSSTGSELRIGGGASVSDKLEALKSLVPSENAEIKTDELFKETAEYIVRLKTQVFVLQKLIDFYGSQHRENAV